MNPYLLALHLHVDVLRAAAKVGEQRPLRRRQRRSPQDGVLGRHRVLRRGRPWGRRGRPRVRQVLHDGRRRLAADGGAGALRAGLRPGRYGARVRRDLKYQVQNESHLKFSYVRVFCPHLAITTDMQMFCIEGILQQLYYSNPYL